MRHLIPNLSTSTESSDANRENDTLSNDLKYKFEAVERYLAQGQGQRHQVHLHQPLDETDDEFLDSSSGIGSSSSSSDDVGKLMALSTAILAQHEIDSLMNGISELENMIQQEDDNNAAVEPTCVREQIHDQNANGVIQTKDSHNFEEIMSNSSRQGSHNQYSSSINR